MSVDATDETGNLVHLTLQGALSTADQATLVAFVGKPFRSIPTEYFTTEGPARAWLEV